MCPRGNKHVDVQFLRIRPLPFPSKDGKDAAFEKRNGWKGKVSIPRYSRCFFFVNSMLEVVSVLLA